MIVLLSPSKKIENTAPQGLPVTDPMLLNQTHVLVKVMQGQTQQDLKNLMGISDKLAELNHGRYQSFEEVEPAPALYTFKGDVYDKMDVTNYGEDDLKFAQEHIRILSGLYGVLRPLDAMRPYRLEMGIKLSTPKGKNLYQFWDDQITKQLNSSGQPIVLNLASQEYFKAIQPKNLKADVVHVDFKHTKNGKTKTIGLMAKRARGLMADYIIKNKITDPYALEKFALEGYKFSENMSGDEVLTFTLNMDA